MKGLTLLIQGGRAVTRIRGCRTVQDEICSISHCPRLSASAKGRAWTMTQIMGSLMRLQSASTLADMGEGYLHLLQEEQREILLEAYSRTLSAAHLLFHCQAFQAKGYQAFHKACASGSSPRAPCFGIFLNL